MENEINIEDFKRICRTCLKFAENLTTISLFNIIEMITSCTSVQILPNDNLPNNLCDLCVVQLQNAFNFKNLCEKSDKELKQLIKKDKKSEVIKSLCTEVDNEIKDEPVNYDYPSDDHSEDNKIVKNEIECLLDTKNIEPEQLNKNNLNIKIEKPISIKKHLKSKKYECEICSRKFGETWKLGIHMRRIHNAEGNKCSRCSFICYHKLHLEVHERSHFEKRVFCKVCNKGFINTRKLKLHSISHSTDRPHHCTQCDLSFKARFILTKHIKTVHVSQIYEVCQVCGKNVRKSYLERHLKIHEERSPYQCTKCSKKFHLEKSLEIHFKRVHENEAIKHPYLCNVCGRGVVSRAELKRHAFSHTGEKPFACDKCDKKYARTGALNHHIRTAHLDVRPYVCTVCSQAFHSKHILQNHMRKHTGERPYSCLVCGKSFGFRCVLKTHMKIHST